MAFDFNENTCLRPVNVAGEFVGLCPLNHDYSDVVIWNWNPDADVHQQAQEWNEFMGSLCGLEEISFMPNTASIAEIEPAEYPSIAVIDFDHRFYIARF